MTGQKIIDALQEAMDGNLARVTIEGVTWVHKAEIDRLRAENAMARVFFQAILDSGQRGYPADLAIEFLAKTAKEVEMSHGDGTNQRPTIWPSPIICKHPNQYTECPDCGSRLSDTTEIDRLRTENAALRKQLMNNSPSTASDSGK